MTSNAQPVLQFGKKSAKPGAFEHRQQPARPLFAIAMIGLGALALIYGDFAMVWQPVARWVPGRTALAYGSGVLMLLCGTALFFQATAKWSVRVLFPYLVAWALLKVPDLVVAPRIEGVWLGFGELAMLLAGGWTLFARMGAIGDKSPLAFASGGRGVQFARILFAVWVIPVGISHFVYAQGTHDLVPAWMPFRAAWGYIAGTGHIASGLGVLFGVVPRIAAWAEAVMLAVITVLVWVPAVIAAPRTRLPWTALFISWAISAAVGVVAQNIEVKSTSARQG